MSHHHCHQGRNAIIRNPRSGLVLDASDNVVKLQHFNGGPSQLWQFEEITPGRYYIVNQCNRKVIDVEGGARNGHSIITYEKHGGENQQWFINSDSTIASVGGGLVLDIVSERYCAGNNLIAYKKHGGDNQKFHLEYI